MPKVTAYQVVCDQVAALLRAERLRQKLSLSAVAARSGLSYQMISYVERNLRVPGLDTLLRITTALEMDAADLVRRAMVLAEAENQTAAE